MSFKQGDLVQVHRDVYGRRIDVKAIVIAVTTQYLVLSLCNGRLMHCYKAEAKLIRPELKERNLVRLNEVSLEITIVPVEETITPETEETVEPKELVRTVAF